jgi:hypothetical protein
LGQLVPVKAKSDVPEHPGYSTTSAYSFEPPAGVPFI